MSENLIVAPPFNLNSYARYESISVSILRPAISHFGPCFALVHRPQSPITFGSAVHLELRYLNSEGVVAFAVDTSVRGTVFAVASFSVYDVEFLLCNDGPGYPFCYLVASRSHPGFTTLPRDVEFAFSLMRPYVYCTYWPENNSRPAPAHYNDVYTDSRYVGRT